ncbi:EAL domain-containing protein [Parendozoicomonas sp. Alg238-R29]|uniref:EAL domain-containing protein n=1 Tax=Parendozoicomonas sp. Alg238-R29 TaxID=2993446 RepID=UPI00248DBF26|nr:EAL domain-containing protein [Parendozoicomonas sp. Alg238-R29]
MNQTAQQSNKPLDLPVVDTDKGWLKTRVRAEQLKHLHKGSLRLFLIVGLCSALTFLLLWSAQSYLPAAIIAAGFVGFGLLRSRMTKTFLSSGLDLSKRQKVWFLFFNLANFIASLFLTIAVITFFPLHHMMNLVILCTAMAAIIFSCAALYSSYLPAFFFFSIPLTLGVSGWLWLSSPDDFRNWALAGPVLLTFMSYPALYVHKVSITGLTRHFMNQALSKRLAKENRKTDEARQDLEETRANLEHIVSNRTRELTRTNTRLNDEIVQREEASQALQESEQRLTQVLDASRLGFWDWNMGEELIYHSRFKELFGYDIEQLDGFKGHLEHLIHPKDSLSVRRAIISHLRGKKELYIARYRIRHAEGHWVWVEDRGQVVEWDEKKRASRMLGTRRDISFERQYEQESRLALTVFENTSDAIFVLNTRFKFMTVNRAFRDLTGYTDEDLLGKSTLDLHPEHGSSDRYREMLETLSIEGHVQGEIREHRKDGETFPIWIQINAVKDNRDNLIHYVGLFKDLTQHKETEERLRYLSNYDSLTGLANRTLFQSRLHEALKIAEKDSKELAVIMIDLDRFRQINDSLGHSTGDELLRHVSRRLLRHTARMHTTARLASDEFAIVIDNWTDKEILEELSKEIIKTLSTPYTIDNHELLIGASIGISRFPENGRELQGLISQADTAMNQSKYLGGNTVQFFNDNMRTSSHERMILERNLRQAIDGDQLEVFYQPKMTLAEGSITTAEALVRWNHPEEGLVMPGKFIALAEETGMIGDIGDFVLEQSCRQARSWLDRGWEIRVSVNISAHQLRKGNLAKQVRETLQRTELPAYLLELEITESQLMDDIEQSIEMLTLVRDQGVTLSIDDFGTGYSSLSYLKRLPVDTLKIDRSFISHLDSNDDDSAITRAIIAMAHSLDLRVVAEGVENRSHIDFLQKHSCDEVQGYFISKPLPVREFDKFLAHRLQITA